MYFLGRDKRIDQLGVLSSEFLLAGYVFLSGFLGAKGKGKLISCQSRKTALTCFEFLSYFSIGQLLFLLGTLLRQGKKTQAGQSVWTRRKKAASQCI
ncbi:hypothetical protein BD289DRAFT_174793 [Coniella lustricola]|uniref:Uncharacterized protein n=1 Tax=Coniella lustricola TaxID=2025994 RepID=A0A2T3ADU6_9PEZI|nr:hypothetical protein BD289DRAFT_174793 [Coniella lustricola]